MRVDGQGRTLQTKHKLDVVAIKPNLDKKMPYGKEQKRLWQLSDTEGSDTGPTRNHPEFGLAFEENDLQHTLKAQSEMLTVAGSNLSKEIINAQAQAHHGHLCQVDTRAVFFVDQQPDHMRPPNHLSQERTYR